MTDTRAPISIASLSTQLLFPIALSFPIALFPIAWSSPITLSFPIALSFPRRRESHNYLFTLFLLIFLFLFSSTLFSQSSSPKREFRGIWIATVENIDFPSNKNLSTQQQKQEFITIIDRLQKDKFNAVIIQVRPSSDALYESSIEPWSEWLTGKQGRSPSPYYDPLKFIIEECHKRGIEVHAWFNPFRSVMNINESNISLQHVSWLHPSWNVTYGKFKWLNPGLPEVREYVLNVIMDVVLRYQIDGVHFDDYFYPYPIQNKKFHDEQAYRKYSRGIRNLNDWRRDNINLFIKSVSESIRKVKPYLQFGISPFGIWKNKSTDPSGSSTRGSESYSSTYADSRKWLKEGWIDYLVPQLYWHIGNPVADYKTLAQWWNDNSFGKNIYLGEAIYKIGSDNHIEWSSASQIPSQIKLNRSLKNIKGNVFFNTNSFLKNLHGVEDSIKNNYYKYFALSPQSKPDYKILPLPPQNPVSQLVNEKTILKWQSSPVISITDITKNYVIYRFGQQETIDISRSDKIAAVLSGTETQWSDPLLLNNNAFTYVITALDQIGNESNDQCRISVPSLYIANNLIPGNFISYNPMAISVNKGPFGLIISVNMAASGFLTLQVYDIYGKEIKRIFYGYKKEGAYQFELPEKELNLKTFIVQLKTSGYFSSKRITIN